MYQIFLRKETLDGEGQFVHVTQNGATQFIQAFLDQAVGDCVGVDQSDVALF